MTFGRVMMACAVGWAAVACSGNVILSSPDGNIKVEHALSEEGVPVLRVSAYGEGVMEISAAGLVAGKAGEAGSIFEYEAALDSAFAMYESLGVHVLKTG